MADPCLSPDAPSAIAPRRVLHWFRRDLRLADNPALEAIGQRGDSLLAVYIHAPEEEAPWQPGAASRWWLHHSLAALRDRLARQGICLLFFHGETGPILSRLCAQLGIDTLSWNRRYEPRLWQRDQLLAEALSAQGLALEAWDDGVLCPPGQLLNQQGRPYRVYGPFMRRLRLLTDSAPLPLGPPLPPRLRPLPLDQALAPGCSLEQLGLLDAQPWHEKLHDHWQPGEGAAWARLEGFLQAPIDHYAEDRDRPGRAGTSRLSPHLHFGEISPQRVLGNVQPLLAGEGGGRPGQSAERLYNQLGWREFARHLLWHFPDSDLQSLDGRFDALWQEDAEWLRRWQDGRTGIALVDAGMAELWQSGWMHNRVRMVAGSLLTKNLGIPWQAGARWFWDTLVDADLANNSLGWQWIAGCGADAAPYFRVFNPQLQAKKFDPQGRYQARWLGSDPLPEPIIDLASSRTQALARYQGMRQSNPA
ncbi:MAG: DNA photolyase family protein [Gammaproteobacteria bacterium SHHR-1]